MLPWQGVLIAGTTDTPCVITDRPAASATDVAFILDALRDHLSVPVRPDDLLAAWAGIRPLAADPTAVPGSTSAISRDHVIFADSDGLVTVTGVQGARSFSTCWHNARGWGLVVWERSGCGVSGDADSKSI